MRLPPASHSIMGTTSCCTLQRPWPTHCPSSHGQAPPLPSPPWPPPPLLFPYGRDCTQKWHQVISTWAQSEVWQCGLNPQQGGAGPGTGNLSRIQAAASVRAPGQGRRGHPAAPGRQGWGPPRKNPLTSLSVSSLTPSRPTPRMQVLRGPFHR